MTLPDRNPARTGAAETEGGKKANAPAAARTEAEPPVPQPKPKPPGPVHPREVQVEPWSKKGIAAAQAVCAQALKDLPVKYLPLSPIREGHCGTPAPISVTAIGAEPEIAIAPNAIMRCPMAAALAKWIRTSVQPTARKHLGAPVVRFRNFAAYVCRNRYNNPLQRISEHARANALDIGAFELSTGETVTVLAHWNAKAPVAPPPPLPQRSPARLTTSATETTGSTEAEPDKNAPRTLIGRLPRRVAPAKAASAKKGDTTEPAPFRPQADKRSLFLRTIHEEACDMFGTVLGPKANAAHANHFHLDLAKRRHRAYCQ